MKTVNEGMKLVKNAGGEFLRATKHCYLFILPNGQRIGVSTSPSDHRVLRKIKAELARKLQE